MQVRDVVLTQEEHRELGKRVSSRRGRADDARIARVLLLLADGASYTQVQQKVGCTAPYISKWKRRFLEERLAGLYARHEGRPVQVLTPRIHVILDNLSAHKTAKVAEFLEANPKVRLHFTPTYSSWLNKVELWFSKIERDLIHRGVFTSTHDLTRKIMRYIRKYNEDPKPVKWTYNDPSRRIKSTKRSVVTVH